MTESTTLVKLAPDDHAFTEGMRSIQDHLDAKDYPHAIAKYNECLQHFGADGNPAHHEALMQLTPVLDHLHYLHIEESLKVALDKCWHFITKKWGPLAHGHLVQAQSYLNALHDHPCADEKQIAKYQRRIMRYERYIQKLIKSTPKEVPADITSNPPVPIEKSPKESFHEILISHDYHQLAFKFSDSPYLQVILPAVGGIYYQFRPSSYPQLNQSVVSLLIFSKKTPLNLPDRDTFLAIRHQILASDALSDLFTMGFPNITLLPNLRARVGHTLFEVDLTFIHLQDEFPEIAYSDDVWECPISELARLVEYLKARYDAYQQVKFEYYEHEQYFFLRSRTLSWISYATIGLSALCVGFALLEGLAIFISPYWYALSGIPLGCILGSYVWYRKRNHKLDHVLHLFHPMTLPVEIKKDLIHLISEDHLEFVECEFGKLSQMPSRPKDTPPLTDPTLPPSHANSPKKKRFELHALSVPRINYQPLKEGTKKILQTIHSYLMKVQIKRKFTQLIEGAQKIWKHMALKSRMHMLGKNMQSKVIQKKEKVRTRKKKTSSHAHQPPITAIQQDLSDFFTS